MGMEKEQKCMIDTRKKIIEYKECLERQLCFVNDCRLGKEAIYQEASKTEDGIITTPFVSTAFTAFGNEIIINLDKIYDDKLDNDIISINSIINLFEKNIDKFPIEWQKEQYKTYCNKYNIDDFVKSFEPEKEFYSIEDSIISFKNSTNPFEGIILNLHKHRNKFYAHNEAKYQRNMNIQKLHNDFPLKEKDIEDLLNIAHLFLLRISMALGETPLAEHSFFF